MGRCLQSFALLQSPPVPSTSSLRAAPVAGAAWLVGFAILALSGSTLEPRAAGWFFALAAAGFLWAWMHAAARERLQGQKLLFVSTIVLAGAIVLSEVLARIFVLSPLHAMPPQPGILLCLLPLAAAFGDARMLRAAIVFFALLCAWHLIAMPVEAITGHNLSWHRVDKFPRESGPFNFQAGGLAGQPFYFPGLHLPLFFLAWGPVMEGRAFPSLQRHRKLLLLLPVLWVIPAAAVQSRSALAGAACAAALAIVGATGVKRIRTWLVAAVLLALAAGLYWVLFTENKSHPSLRVAYFKHYVQLAIDSPWLLTGHGYSLEPQWKLVPPGVQPVLHSHNDISQILYCWGLIALVAYIVFWVALVRDAVMGYVRRGEFWPVCALVALLPSIVTDLGLQHYEKAVFLVLFTAFCIGVSRYLPRGERDAR